MISEFRLAAVFTAVAWARRFTRHALAGWGAPKDSGLVDAAELAVSELVTNALRATGVTTRDVRWVDLCATHLNVIAVQLHLSTGGLLVQVWDADPTPPVAKAAGPDSEGGRGLPLVAAISTAWNHYRPTGGGKVVWCRIPFEPAEEADATLRLTRVPSDINQPGPLPDRRPAPHEAPDLSVLRRVIEGLRRLDDRSPAASPAASRLTALVAR